MDARVWSNRTRLIYASIALVVIGCAPVAQVSSGQAARVAPDAAEGHEAGVPETQGGGSSQSTSHAPQDALLLSTGRATAHTADREEPSTQGALVGSTVGDRTSATAQGSMRFVVAAVGDSLTDPRASGGKYLDTLRERCPRSRFDSYGVAGSLVANMRARFAYDVLGEGRGASDPAPRYTHVIILGGVNDIGSDKVAHRPIERIEEDLGAMYTMARARGIEVIAMTLTPWSTFPELYSESRGKKTRELNDWILSQPSTGLVTHVIDAHALLSCGDPEQLCPRWENRWVRDGLHFNGEAHAVLGQALYEKVFSRCE